MKKNLLIAFLIIAVAFIWGQSMLPEGLSTTESTLFTEKVLHPIERFLFGTESWSTAVVRKFAHVLEFAVLGFLLHLLFRHLALPRPALKALSFGGLVGLLDETVQILSGRSAMVSDIWLDISGTVIGIALAALWHRRKRKI
ncbi:MAG: VanZ family protein [Christensenellales bacterium]|jgi:VanZ family protein